jgi:hypothetical protein
MPDSDKRPIGRGTAALPAASNRPGGWAGYLAARDPQAPTPPKRRHGNQRHGKRTKAGVASRRMIRACIRMLRAGCWNAPVPGLPRRPPGWASFRDRHELQAAGDPTRPLSFLVTTARTGDLGAAMEAGSADARPAFFP